MRDRLNERIGKKLEQRRMRLGLSQSALALQAGLNRSTVQRHESGESGVKASDLFRMARALEVPMGYFFGDE